MKNGFQTLKDAEKKCVSLLYQWNWNVLDWIDIVDCRFHSKWLLVHTMFYFCYQYYKYRICILQISFTCAVWFKEMECHFSSLSNQIKMHILLKE